MVTQLRHEAFGSNEMRPNGVESGSSDASYEGPIGVLKANLRSLQERSCPEAGSVESPEEGTSDDPLGYPVARLPTT
ncbi:hypothetical protein BHM03_00024216 [Ensete ventricosum]|nr:hypothetical protein BHM03_00024216 [Ensete ventricosum]